MIDFKSHLCHLVFLLMSTIFFVSCGAIHSTDGPAGNLEKKTAAETRISRLESELSAVKQGQAELVVQMENKNTTLETLEETLLTMEKKISALEKKPSAARYTAPSVNPTSLYKKARNVLIEGNYETAADLFTEFINTYPQDHLADNAVYWLGECYYSLGEYHRAISVFKDLELKYPTSDKTPDALLKLGYSYLSLADANRANHYLKQVLKKYPFSSAAEKAQEKLEKFE
ncbi:tol-pal system protein YbgF [Desulfobacula sp.]|uniref:tol-pal system protein YbgF n=1 Tax=Desulfobacula sp. TaxID=2593537 RepID=UPI00260488DE|nr:tol-pal system protein YbgF [Desulfobacula sp.]